MNIVTVLGSQSVSVGRSFSIVIVLAIDRYIFSRSPLAAKETRT